MLNFSGHSSVADAHNASFRVAGQGSVGLEGESNLNFSGHSSLSIPLLFSSSFPFQKLGFILRGEIRQQQKLTLIAELIVSG